MAYASSYDKFEDLEYTQMMKTKLTKLYAKKRRLKCCGIALSATYNVNRSAADTPTTATASGTATTSVDEYTTDMIKSSKQNSSTSANAKTNNGSSSKKRTCCGRSSSIAALLLGVCLVVALVGALVWVCKTTASSSSTGYLNGTDADNNKDVAGSLDSFSNEVDNRQQESRKNHHDDGNGNSSSSGGGGGARTHTVLLPAASSLPSATSPSVYPGDGSILFSDAMVETTPPVVTTTEESTHNANVEYVIPLKQGPKPLHTQDIIYDEIRNITPAAEVLHHQQQQQQRANHISDSSSSSHDGVLPSGHFRDNTAEVFDPHPEYVINAFGRRFVLVLSQNSDFTPTNLRVVEIERNNSRKVNTTKTNPACDYTGTVRGEFQSFVAVSLCNGMNGYLRTSDGDYKVEPVEDYDSTKHTKTSIRHKMTKLPPAMGGLHDHDHDEIVTDPLVDLHFLDQQQQVHGRRKRTTDSSRLDDDVVNMNNSYYYQQYHYQHYGSDEHHHQQQRKFINQHSTKPYFIATLVVADRKMYEYHKNKEDLTRYILTLMSHVALLFKDATIGNPIILVVVDIMILYDVDFTSPTSSEVLRRFCEYQKLHSRARHDVALLFTRDVICRNASVEVCTTLGVAEVGSMCIPRSSCAIVRDKGLSTSFTIAHELGHVLSMPHDDDKKCNSFNNASQPNKIMAKSLHNDTQPWHWSQCSKHYLTEFLNSPRASCLLDEPQQDHIRMNPLRPHDSLLPGETFQADRQCELEFGIGSKICSFMPECSTLWCTHEYDMVESSGCKTQYMPWADGTPCGRNKMCLQGKCTYRNNFHPVAGGWGTWQPSGTCSRTCGGGIMMYVRECNSPTPAHGGTYCTGGSRYYESCNTQACAQNTPDFREMQCAQFNGNNKGLLGLNDTVRWVPKYGTNPEDACKLYCRVLRSTSYYLLEPKVLDGTKCGLNSYDICVNGVCLKAGCDNKLGSNVTLDDCGNCGGDNSQCHMVTGFYNNSAYGYNQVVLIPRGSSNIVIHQKGQKIGLIDENYLALKEPPPISEYKYKLGRSGLMEYLLNGNSVISGYTKDIIYGGLTFRYSGSNNTDESIMTPRNAKLTKSILVEVLQVGNLTLPNITYSYTIGNAEAPNYSWERYKDEWTSCDSMCLGYRYPVAKCKDMSLQRQVDDSYCAEMERGSPVACNTHCELEWRLASRGPCSAYCGSGWTTLSYQCVKVNSPGGKVQIVDEKHCSRRPSPELRETCEGTCESTYYWKYQKWSQCTKTCGGGYQERRAACVDDQDNVVNDSHCSGQGKQVKQVCNGEACPPTWVYLEWSACSVTCGSGVRRRQSSCREGDHIVSRHFCDGHTLKPIEESCTAAQCVEPIWMKGDWNECNGHCGDGTYQQRLVTCMDAYTQETLQDEHCRGTTKPSESKVCRLLSCEYEWRTSDWSKCSEKCGRGKQVRQVRCSTPKDIGQQLEAEPERYCDVGKRPVNVTSCEGVDCDRKPEWKDWKYEWVPGKFGECSTSCGTGIRNRIVTCRVLANGSTYKVVEQACNRLSHKPPLSKPCKRYNCPYAWVESNWSPCSTTCGPGFRTRNATCFKVLQNNHVRRVRGVRHAELLRAIPSDDSTQYCPTYSRPRTREACNEMDCNAEYFWKKVAWRPCKLACGMERQKRRVYCVNRRGKKVRDEHCARPKPRKRRKCNNLPCHYPKSCKEVKAKHAAPANDDYLLMLQNVVVKIYCYKMDTDSPEEYITLPPGSANYAEFYGKQLRAHVTDCPRRDSERDSETLGGRVERTDFWKVRIDVTEMKIIGDDFTFSKNKNDSDNRLKYGTAGDCFTSVKGCVRGAFKIDLSGTSFRLATNVTWIAYGQSATQKIFRTNKYKVNGECGGYCGGCVPNPNIGLEVEVT